MGYKEMPLSSNQIDVKDIGFDYYVEWHDIFNMLQPDLFVPTVYEAKYGFNYFKNLALKMTAKPVLTNLDFYQNVGPATQSLIEKFKIVEIGIEKRKILFLSVLCSDFVSRIVKISAPIKSLK